MTTVSQISELKKSYKVVGMYLRFKRTGSFLSQGRVKVDGDSVEEIKDKCRSKEFRELLVSTIEFFDDDWIFEPDEKDSKNENTGQPPG